MITSLSFTDISASRIEADALVVAVVPGPGGPALADGAASADAAFGGGLLAALATLGATGRAEEVTRLPAPAGMGASLIAAVGLGPAGPGSPSTAGPAGAVGPAGTAATDGDPGDDARRAEQLRRAAGAAVRSLLPLRPARIAISMPAADAASAEAVALGALLGGYTFARYRSDGYAGPELTVVAAGDHVPGAVARAEVIGSAVTLVRDLVNASPSDLYPEVLATEASKLAAENGLVVEVLDETDLAAGGYGGLIAVGQGSARPPRLVRAEYRHPSAARTIVLIGKGITFDSGGLSLKPAKSMETMKSDMGGAAAVLGAMQALAALRPAVNVIGYLPLAENMPGAGATRPSDVITMYGGTTVEVLNTDAEGRLILADVLARSAEDEPDLVVDVATLTGAQVVALGTRIAGVMANDDALRDAVVDAARRAGEQMWPMPLPDELRKGLDSKIADLANVTGERDAGMLSAGLFLREFVPDGVPWAHLDIAGPAFLQGEPYGYTPKGGTGASVRTLVQIALDVADGRLRPA